MQNRKMLLLFFLVGLSQLGWTQTYLPHSKGTVVSHTYYTLSYLEKQEQAEWVYYCLTPSMLTGHTKRTNNFRKDTAVPTGSATLADYQRSGYDRGHLMPAGDMTMNATAMSESFYLSNMSPQLPAFNRGIWKSLEALVRGWAHHEKLYIVTGGVLEDGLAEIGPNGVDVPNYYYKVIYAPKQQQMIAFILPNKKVTQPLINYVVTTDKVEQLTHIDFFAQLPDTLEDKLEKSRNITHWNFTAEGTKKSYSSYSTTSNRSKRAAVKKRTTSNTTSRCCAITKGGTRCKRNAKNGSRYCWQHQKKKLKKE
ncbi:MAG: DNA/RNA non-specific endonuclease [Bacteroidaceae bacterium]|nr:DNA/RNA non-specific endonuclease [Bacteroidaceae bacterium]